MSIAERNRFLQILHNNGTKRQYIIKILLDTKNLFEDNEEIDYDPLEIISDEIFNNRDRTEEELELMMKRSFVTNITKESRLRHNEMIFYQKFMEKQKEVELHENIQNEPIVYKDQLKNIPVSYKYGRSPLHQAIASGDLKVAKILIKQGKYLNHQDNSRHTPQEMAHYMGYKKAIKLFKKKKNK
jgi:ankyrin repeat protein